MSAWVPMDCPVDGCSYVATFRLDNGEETGSATSTAWRGPPLHHGHDEGGPVTDL